MCVVIGDNLIGNPVPVRTKQRPERFSFHLDGVYHDSKKIRDDGLDHCLLVWSTKDRPLAQCQRNSQHPAVRSTLSRECRYR